MRGNYHFNPPNEVLSQVDPSAGSITERRAAKAAALCAAACGVLNLAAALKHPASIVLFDVI